MDDLMAEKILETRASLSYKETLKESMYQSDKNG